jgi:hypothetical protein
MITISDLLKTRRGSQALCELIPKVCKDVTVKVILRELRTSEYVQSMFLSIYHRLK